MTDSIGSLLEKRERTDVRRRADNADEQPDAWQWLDDSIGRRYVGCSFGNFEVTSDKQAKALEVCRQYARDFSDHVRAGSSLVLLGPKGTGKDHLMIAVIKDLIRGYKPKPGTIVYRDGLRLFAEFRNGINTGSEDAIVSRYVTPRLLALSDPVPPSGALSEYEQRMLLRIIDGRYRDCLPTAVTVNVATRDEIDKRMSAQVADRLCDGAVLVACNWKSYRKPRGQS